MLVLFLLIAVYLIGQELGSFFLDRKHPPSVWVSVSFGLGLLSLYPIGLINLLIEGQSNFYQTHIYRELALLYIAWAVLVWVRLKYFRLHMPRYELIFHLPKTTYLLLFLAGILIFGQMGYASINGDEREIGYRAYDLVDGIKASRNAFVISFNDHAPLGNYIQHFVTNAINPAGFWHLTPDQLRMSAGIMAILSLFVALAITEVLSNRQTAILTGLFALSSALFIFSGRIAIPQDLAYWNVYLLLSLLLLLLINPQIKLKLIILCGIIAGAFGLIKFTGVLLFPLALVWIWIRTKNKFFCVAFLATAMTMILPIVIFNLGAYLTTGYVDVPTAILVRTLGLKVNSSMSDNNIYGGVHGLFSYIGQLTLTLADMIQPLVLILLTGLSLWGVLVKKDLKLVLFAGAGLIYLIFYSVIGFRAYYLTFVALWLSIGAAIGLSRLSFHLRWACIGLILIISSIYTFNSVIAFQGLQMSSIGEYGRSQSITAPLSLNFDHSLTLRSWLKHDGWQEVQQELLALNQQGTVPVVTDILARHSKSYWYLQKDPVREHFDANYQTPIKYYFETDNYCPENVTVLTFGDQSTITYCDKQLVRTKSITAADGQIVFSELSQN